MRRISSLALNAILLVGASDQAGGQDNAASVSYVRIYADTVGASHFADERMPLTLIDPGRAIQPTPASAPFAVTRLVVLCPPSGASVDWHPAPRRQLNVILTGEYEVEVSDGEVRRFAPGSLLLVEDTDGKGHQTRISGEEEACFAAAPLADPGGTDRRSHAEPLELRGSKASGTLEPVGAPLTRPVRLSTGTSCIVEVKQAYDVTGTLAGSVEIDFRILVYGPCGSPAGTFDEEWIAYGTFSGMRNGSAASGRFTYTARAAAGGDVEGWIVLGRGIAGVLAVSGNFADGRLHYDGWVGSE